MILAALFNLPLPDVLQRTREAFDWLQQELAAINISVSIPKCRCLLPAPPASATPAVRAQRHDIAEQQLGLPVEREEGLLMMGVPVGSQDYIAATAQQLLLDSTGQRLLHELVSIHDSQVAYALLRMCYGPRATYIMRNVGREALQRALERVDALSLGALAAILQEPAATAVDCDLGDDSISDWQAYHNYIMGEHWQGDAPLSFSAAQRLQAQLRHSQGGFGIRSTLAHASAALLGRTVAVLAPAIEALPQHQQALLRGKLLQTRTLLDAQAALQHLLQSGMQREQLLEIVPDYWLQWAAEQGDALLTATCPSAQPAATANVATPDSLPPRLQAKLSAFVDDEAARRLEALVNDSTLSREQKIDFFARWRSQAAKGSMAFLSVLPSNERDMTMSGSDFREAGRRALGIERPDPGGLCSSCHRELTAVHARRCGGGITSRHNAVRNAMASALSHEAGLTGVEKESREPFASSTNPSLRIDVVIPGGQMAMPGEGAGAADKAALVDVTLIDPGATEYRLEASRTAGAAAATKAQEKYNHYLPYTEGARFTLFPVAIELFGAACAETHTLVKALAVHQAQSSGGAWSVSQCVARWRQRLSVVMQRSVSASVASAFARVERDEDRPIPNVGAFAHVRLLLRPPALG
jgi:hypothetical protein